MISLHNIVKSFAVVDNRKNGAESGKQPNGGTVIKKGVLNGYAFSLEHSQMIHKDVYLDELNRLRVEIKEAKIELKDIQKEIEETREQHAKLGIDDDEDILDDELYYARKRELQEVACEAERQAEKLRADAETASEEIMRQAKETGYGDGFLKGSEEASAGVRRDAELKLEELAVIIENLSAYGEELMASKEDEFVELVFAVSRKVIAREIKTDPKFIIDMLRDFLTKNHRESYINLSLSPDMVSPKVKTNDEVLAKLRDIAANLSLYIEKEAEEGTAVLETPRGVTDMSIDTQLANIREKLMAKEQQ